MIKLPIKTIVNEAIEISWKWVHTEENLGEALYDFLDNEENGFTLKGIPKVFGDYPKACVNI